MKIVKIRLYLDNFLLREMIRMRMQDLVFTYRRSMKGTGRMELCMDLVCIGICLGLCMKGSGTREG